VTRVDTREAVPAVHNIRPFHRRRRRRSRLHRPLTGLLGAARGRPWLRRGRPTVHADDGEIEAPRRRDSCRCGSRIRDLQTPVSVVESQITRSVSKDRGYGLQLKKTQLTLTYFFVVSSCMIKYNLNAFDVKIYFVLLYFSGRRRKIKTRATIHRPKRNLSSHSWDSQFTNNPLIQSRVLGYCSVSGSAGTVTYRHEVRYMRSKCELFDSLLTWIMYIQIKYIEPHHKHLHLQLLQVKPYFTIEARQCHLQCNVMWRHSIRQGRSTAACGSYTVVLSFELWDRAASELNSKWCVVTTWRLWFDVILDFARVTDVLHYITLHYNIVRRLISRVKECG